MRILITLVIQHKLIEYSEIRKRYRTLKFNTTTTLTNSEFNELSTNDLMLVEGGNWVRTAFGVVGGIAGGISAFVGTAAATSPVLTPLGAGIVGAIAAPAGVATGFVAGVEVYDFIFK